MEQVLQYITTIAPSLVSIISVIAALVVAIKRIKKESNASQEEVIQLRGEKRALERKNEELQAQLIKANNDIAEIGYKVIRKGK